MSDAEIFNGNFEWNSNAGWSSHGGDCQISVGEGRAKLTRLNKGPVTSNWFWIDDACTEVSVHLDPGHSPWQSGDYVSVSLHREHADVISSGIISLEGDDGTIDVSMLIPEDARNSLARLTMDLNCIERDILDAAAQVIQVSGVGILGVGMNKIKADEAQRGAAHDMVRIEPGRFLMGSPSTEPGRMECEERHMVQITKPFMIGRYEVTEGLWAEVTGDGDVESRKPRVNVSWLEAVRFAMTCPGGTAFPKRMLSRPMQFIGIQIPKGLGSRLRRSGNMLAGRVPKLPLRMERFAARATMTQIFMR